MNPQLERWLETSRLNPMGLLRMPHPRISGQLAEIFDRLLAQTHSGSEVSYDVAAPKWWFLHHLIGRGFLLHGSNKPAIERFRTRANRDAYGNPIDAVFASDGAIWPLYFAVVRRDGLEHGYMNVVRRRLIVAGVVGDRGRRGRAHARRRSGHLSTRSQAYSRTSPVAIAARVRAAHAARSSA